MNQAILWRGGKLYFGAKEAATGTELYVLDLGADVLLLRPGR